MANTIVKAAVKEHLADQNVSSDFYDALDNEVSDPESPHPESSSGAYDALDNEVSDLLDDAVRRAEDNDRKTVQARDL